MRVSTKCTRQKYVCSSERIKLIGAIDGLFPDFGHHLENEMGGLWFHPIKLLDGFWMRFTDHSAENVDCYILADDFQNYPHKNEFYYSQGLGHTTVIIKRTQLAPENLQGVIISYEFRNTGENTRNLSCEFIARTDLRPAWYSESINISDGEVDEIKYLPEWTAFHAKDAANEWHTVIGSDIPCDRCDSGQFFGPEYTHGKGVSCKMQHHFELEPHQTKVITYYIAGSDRSEADCLVQYKKLLEPHDFEKIKIEKYEKMYGKSKLTVADKRFEEIYQWVKVNTDWLIFDTTNNGRGLVAGLPEYTQWFGCDSFYALQGVLCMGDYQLCRDTLELIYRYSAKINGNGRIVHEVTTCGACPNKGNTQETAHFISMMWKYYEWTGDFTLIDEAFDYMQKSIEWLQEQDDDKDLFPTGYGIIEIAGLNMEMIDTAVYTCEAFDCYSKMCTLKGMCEKALAYKEHAEAMKIAINNLLWDEEAGLYCDAYTSYAVIDKKRQVILQQTKAAKTEAVKKYIEHIMDERKSDKNKERGWLLNRNWIINTPMETGLAEVEKAGRALEILHTDCYIGEYGMYLDGLKQDSVMTISTGVMAVAQVQYGYADRALELIEKIFKSFSIATPGSISEMSPDYGCFAQAWTVYAVLLPIVRYFFGIQPSASGKKIIFNPVMPSKWEKCSLEDVKVFDAELSISYEKTDEKKVFTVRNQTGFPIEIPGDPMIYVSGAACEESNGKRLIGAEHKKFTVTYII